MGSENCIYNIYASYSYLHNFHGVNILFTSTRHKNDVHEIKRYRFDSDVLNREYLYSNE